METINASDFKARCSALTVHGDIVGPAIPEERWESLKP